MSTSASDGASGLARPLAQPQTQPQPRSDVRQRDIIDHAIAVQTRCNTVAALEYLKSCGVAPGLIERVLLEPQRRRAVQRP